MERDHYIDVVTKALTLLPPDTVVARLTGDGMGDDLLAPDWSRKKVSVINDIDKRMYELDWWQGKQYEVRPTEK
jgi:radical SAM superfamily enzyme